jgi:hypothetical protein
VGKLLTVLLVPEPCSGVKIHMGHIITVSGQMHVSMKRHGDSGLH